MPKKPANPEPPLTIEELRTGTRPTLGAREVAPLLGVSPAYVYALAAEGKLPSIPLGSKRVRFSTAAILRLIDPDTDQPATAIAN
jgi:excisionase family DNA binding protein